MYIAAEVLHDLAVLSAYAFEICIGGQSADEVDPDNPRYIRLNGNEDGGDEDSDKYDSDDEEEGINGAYFAQYDPPFQTDSEGKINCIVIPRHVKEAAERNGMKPLMGLGLGYGWVQSNNYDDEDDHTECTDGKVEAEVHGAVAQYYPEAGTSKGEDDSDESRASSDVLESFDIGEIDVGNDGGLIES